MKVLHLTRDFPPHRTGGLSEAVGGLVHALRQAGIHNAVVSFDGWRPAASTRGQPRPLQEETDGVELWRVTTPRQADPALEDAARWQPDVVHVHHGMLWEFAERLGVASRVVTTHVLQLELNRLRGITAPTLSLAGQEKALEAAQAVIAPSAAVTKILASDYPEIVPRLHHIGLGAEGLARESHPTERARDALYVGRFSDVKGTAELFDAIPRLLTAVDDVRVVISGGNPESRKSERRWLRRFERVVPVCMRNRVELTGWLDPAGLARRHRKARILLCPSWFETFGLAALEALARGVPVVGTTGGALPELVIHETTGLLAPPRDVETFVANAARLLVEPDLAERMGKAAAADVCKRFTWKNVVELHENVYRSIA